MASHARLIFSRIGHHRHHFSPVIIRYSHFSTHTNGARAVSNGGWLSYLSWLGHLGELMEFGEFMSRKGFVVVPQGSACLVERARKYFKTLPAGLHFMVPLRDKVCHFHSLKVQTLTLSGHHVVSKDNVAMTIEASLMYQVVDPVLASYEVKDTIEAMIGLADAIMRANIGGISLDKILHEREILNEKIVMALCDDTKCWGLHILNFEIRDISMNPGMKKTMIMQACTERKKMAKILVSEGERQSSIIIADGARSASMLIAKGEAEAHEIIEAAKGKSISAVAKVLGNEGADRAVKSRITKQSIEAFKKIAAEMGTTIIVPKA